ncbi:MAG: ribonuclease III [Synoicihabitans sp.]
MSVDPVAQLQARIGHTFADPQLLDLALTHPSWLQEFPGKSDSNQRLEFLGDAVLQLSLTDQLYQRYPEEREGDLSKRRAALANGTYLAAMANEVELGAALKLSRAEEDGGGRMRESALEDAFEALLGAIYLDAGFEKAKSVVIRLFGDLDARLGAVVEAENPKGQLQERVQPTLGNGAIRYEVQHVSGEDHARNYEARVFLQDTLIGTGRGTSKKSAEEAAAWEGLNSPLLPR